MAPEERQAADTVRMFPEQAGGRACYCDAVVGCHTHPARTIAFLARNIVNQLFDLAEVPVEKRQAINDEADAFVYAFVYKLLLAGENLRDGGMGEPAGLGDGAER